MVQRPNSRASSKTIMIGRDRFEKISTVEGIKLTTAMKKRTSEFDRRGLSPIERRCEIINVHRRPER